MTIDQRDLADAAQAAARRGWRVFPLRADDKRPAVRDWEARATTDAERITRCWSAGPYNVGIACGPSGLVVIDLDTPKPETVPPPEWQLPGVLAGDDVLAVVSERAGAPMPLDTFTVRTGRGGMHLYFTAPPGTVLRNTAGRLGWLIDTRAAGGYVVAAGSVVAGRPYRLLHDTTPAPLPGWIAGALRPPGPRPPAALSPLLDRVGRRSTYAAAALRGELDRVLTARPGTRNVTLNTSAHALGQLVGARLLPPDLVTEALTLAALSIGLTPGETAATIRSGLASGVRHPRTVPA
jgi:hypothetical protein